MKISITLPSIYPALLQRALNNVRDTSSVDIEVIVVSPFEPEVPPMRPGQVVKWVREEQKRGSLAAHTMGLNSATGDFITAKADDVLYAPGWDVAALEHMQRDRVSRLVCLGLNYGEIGTVFGIYYPNFPFLRRDDAASIGYFDPHYRAGFGDCDLGLKIWSAGGRCEFTPQRLLQVTEEDKKDNGTKVLCAPEDYTYFLDRWAAQYGDGFDTSHLRGFNIDFDPDDHSEYVQDFSVNHNHPNFMTPRLIGSLGAWNVALLSNAAFAIPQWIGEVDLRKEADRARTEAAGGRRCRTIADAFNYAYLVSAHTAQRRGFPGPNGIAAFVRRVASGAPNEAGLTKE